MTVGVRYGKGYVEVDVPEENLLAVLRAKPARRLGDPASAVRAALERPLGCPPLAELARGKANATVVIPDFTRPLPHAVVLPPILRTLVRAGIAPERITLLLATGMHEPTVGRQLVEMLGVEIISKHVVRNHYARRRAEHVLLGETPQGMPVWVDKGYIEAELRVLVGLVEPHYMAGFSGGRKAICPGLCATETIKELHSAELLDDPRATNLVLEQNPVHERALDAAKMAGAEFTVNVTVDEERELTGVWAGELEEAHLAACRFAEEHAVAQAPERADVVITSSAGYPLDAGYYQATKGMVGALPCVKPGGTIILAAELSQGLGSAEFAQLLRSHDSLDALRKTLYDPRRFVVDQWAGHMLLKALADHELLLLCDGLSEDDARAAFATPIASLEEGLERALAKHGPKARVIVIPDGPYVIPRVG